jgi:hypothetical protein
MSSYILTRFDPLFFFLSHHIFFLFLLISSWGSKQGKASESDTDTASLFSLHYFMLYVLSLVFLPVAYYGIYIWDGALHSKKDASSFPQIK